MRWMRPGEWELSRRGTWLLFPVVAIPALCVILVAIEEIPKVGWLFALASLLVLLVVVAAVSIAFRRSREQPHTR